MSNNYYSYECELLLNVFLSNKIYWTTIVLNIKTVIQNICVFFLK